MPAPRVSFFTAGTRTSYGESYIIASQCYVQYVPPRNDAETADTVPLLFVHGGGLTGSQWESTPDRRPGWAALASQEGRHVYIMDGVDSDRSQRAPDSVREAEVEYRDAKQIWDRFRFGPLDGWDERKPFDDSAFPVEYLDQLVATQAGRRRTADEIEAKGIVDVVRELAVNSRVDVVAHSNGAMLLSKALDQIADLLRNIVFVEPGPKTDATALLEEPKTLVVWGEYIEGHAMWTPLKSAMEGANVEELLLPNVGVRGNSHFPMSDQNSDKVWKQISHWLESSSDFSASRFL
ncbi:putative secreted lipase [Pseudocercospora fuligena]|uniref:Putative secreted lipase n=1 Tax=Pseudocercospora fuligena TaxID=685502 RepID=A0A8H6VF18_9PEZI|nr:putative secreted lipase [Pseudocercospora fuligena]